LEAPALINTLDDVIVHHHERPPTPSRTLLAQLQADVEADREPAPGPILPTDRTVQLHACHGTTRQLEVLRDALSHLFAADPTLLARDVAVLCPDLPRFAPLIESVFGRGGLPVPVRV